MASEAERTRHRRARIEAVLDRLRPGFLADGGNAELIAVAPGGVVTVAFQGACVRCPAQLATLRLVIEATLRRELPFVAQVVVAGPRPAPSPAPAG